MFYCLMEGGNKKNKHKTQNCVKVISQVLQTKYVMSVCLHWARQEEGTLQSLGEEPVGGPFPPAPCRCLTLGISSDNNRRRKWAQQPREPFPLCPRSSPSATWTCWWPARSAGSSWGTNTALSVTVSDAKPRTRYVVWKADWKHPLVVSGRSFRDLCCWSHGSKEH